MSSHNKISLYNNNNNNNKNHKDLIMMLSMQLLIRKHITISF